jgi:hypothetical protein
MVARQKPAGSRNLTTDGHRFNSTSFSTCVYLWLNLLTAVAAVVPAVHPAMDAAAFAAASRRP